MILHLVISRPKTSLLLRKKTQFSDKPQAKGEEDGLDGSRWDPDL